MACVGGLLYAGIEVPRDDQCARDDRPTGVCNPSIIESVKIIFWALSQIQLAGGSITVQTRSRNAKGSALLAVLMRGLVAARGGLVVPLRPLSMLVLADEHFELRESVWS